MKVSDDKVTQTMSTTSSINKGESLELPKPVLIKPKTIGHVKIPKIKNTQHKEVSYKNNIFSKLTQNSLITEIDGNIG